MRNVLAVFAGGLVGTGLRLAVDLALPHPDDAFPVATLLVNLTGALALGVLAGGLWRLPCTPAWLKAGVGTGVLGSFTTFSALAVSLTVLAAAEQWWTAAAYVGASVVGGLALATLGLALGARWVHGRMPRTVTDRGATL